jgi:hypothetical protein
MSKKPKKNKILNFVLDEDLHKWLKVYAISNDKTMNEVLTELVEELRNDNI